MTIKDEDYQKLINIAKTAENYLKKRDYLTAYRLYKLIYRNYNELRVIPNLIDITFLSIKKGLIKNRNLKFKLMTNLINFGLTKDNNTKLTHE